MRLNLTCPFGIGSHKTAESQARLITREDGGATTKKIVQASHLFPEATTVEVLSLALSINGR